MNGLAPLREEIDAIDRELTALFLRRMEVTHQVGVYKQAHGIPVLDAQREQEVLASKASWVDTPGQKQALTALFEAIMGISRQDQRTLVREGGNPAFERIQASLKNCRAPLKQPRILYQGEPGAYAHQAANLFFEHQGDISQSPTWDALFQDLVEGRADYGVVPIENNSTGSINQIYDLLAQKGLYIVGEQMVQVNHCLAAPKGATLEGLSRIYSHEQGLLQCDAFLKTHPTWKGIPRSNTAESAQFVASQGDLTQGAICSAMAAEIYGLEILAHAINTNRENFTRFVVVSPVMERRAGCDKVSAVVVLPHKAGSLHQLMTIFAVNGLNMLKLESRPIMGRAWEYLFFVDFSGDLGQAQMEGVLHELTQSAEGFQVLGNYKTCQTEGA